MYMICTQDPAGHLPQQQQWKGQYVQIKTGKAFLLSEQEVIDCNGAPNGCRGGSLQQASDFVIHNHGLTTNTSYPYTANDKGACSSNKTPPVATINGYQSVPQGDEGALLKAVANQPVTVVLDPSLLQFCKSRIISGECGLTLHHAITAVGYGTSENGTKYWIFKNSWGPNWGENGYVRMQRDIGAAEGICGIAMGPLYPTA